MRRFAGSSVLFAALGLTVLSVSMAHAAIFTVNDTTDAVDANPGDGICATAAGTCTLRAAVQETNALPGPDTILVPAGTYALTIPGIDEEAAATGDLDVTDVLEIDGAGADTTIVDGGGLYRLFDVHPPVSASSLAVPNSLSTPSASFNPALRAAIEQAVRDFLDAKAKRLAGDPSAGRAVAAASSALAVLAPAGSIPTRPSLKLSGLTLRNGVTEPLSAGDPFSSGGAVSAINADLSLVNCTIENSSATNSGGGIFVQEGVSSIVDSVIENNQGGGFFTHGQSSIVNSVIENNQGGALDGVTDSVCCPGPIVIERTHIRRNVGGGLGFGVADFTIKDSTIEGNQGGGINAVAVLGEITGSTISGNQSSGSGGGIFVGGTATGETNALSLIETTVSGNTAANQGGGVAVGEVAHLIVRGGTIANNQAAQGGGIAVFDFRGAKATLYNTLLAGNRASTQGPDCYTAASLSVQSEGHNLIGDATDCTVIASTGDLLGSATSPIDPRLGPLADNGGPTWTQALLRGSPAIDAGSPDPPGSSNTACEPTDQRGITRPQDGDLDGDPAVCDIGAFELVPRIDVAIEVEPFFPKDPIILTSPLPIPVVVLGSDTVDVTKIDVTSVRFGPKGATPVFDLTNPIIYQLSLVDVNRDGHLDLVAWFRVQDTGLAFGDTQACLEGWIVGQPFQGCDDVVIRVRGCGLGFELAPILPALLWLRGRRRRKLA